MFKTKRAQREISAICSLYVRLPIFLRLRQNKTLHILPILSFFCVCGRIRPYISCRYSHFFVFAAE